MSATPPDSPRVAEARSRAAERAARQGARMHVALWGVMVLTTASVLQSRPHPGVAGERLVISLALAGCLLALAIAALARGTGKSEAATAALPLILGAGGNVLALLQATGMMVIPVSTAVAMLFARLRPRLAGLLAVPLTVAIAVITGYVSSRNAVQNAGAGALLCAVLGAAYVFARQARLRHDHTELLLAELEDSREAQARAAAVAERTRIAREALTNAARYAAGSPTTVVLRYTPQATTLTIPDHGRAVGADHSGTETGVPVPPVEAWTGGGNGLRGMRERIERVGGRIHAGPTGQGWTVEREIPA